MCTPTVGCDRVREGVDVRNSKTSSRAMQYDGMPWDGVGLELKLLLEFPSCRVCTPTVCCDRVWEGVDVRKSKACRASCFVAPPPTYFMWVKNGYGGEEKSWSRLSRRFS